MSEHLHYPQSAVDYSEAAPEFPSPSDDGKVDSTIGETIPPPISPGRAALLNARSAELGRKVLLDKGGGSTRARFNGRHDGRGGY